MSTIALKLTSLAIRTLAKPIANSIKQQAREHGRFRALCIGIAQVVHRTDMRIRLNLLRDNSVIERAEEAEEQRKAEKESIATLAKNTEAFDKSSTSTSKPDDSGVQTPPPSPSANDSATSTPKKKRSPTFHIRPLSDAKAIEKGANFISEFFLFSVAGGLILFEALRSRKKEMNRRDEVAERLQNLEEVDEIWRRKVEMLERSLDAAGIKRVAEQPLQELETKSPPASKGLASKISGYLFSAPNQAENSGNSNPNESQETTSAAGSKSLVSNR